MDETRGNESGDSGGPGQDSDIDDAAAELALPAVDASPDAEPYRASQEDADTLGEAKAASYEEDGASPQGDGSNGFSNEAAPTSLDGGEAESGAGESGGAFALVDGAIGVQTAEADLPDGGLEDCPQGLTECSGSCVNLQTDSTHCGACAHACASDQLCRNATCSCPGEQQSCDGRCTNTQSDNTHCGGCESACPPGQVCSNGDCRPTCPAGLATCEGSCPNLQTDPGHCGDCLTACSPEQLCRNGACSCPGSQHLCGSHCTDRLSDGMNCGRCGNACSSGTVCSGGACVQPPCPGGLANCAGSCVNMASDPAHCGDCSTSCLPEQLCLQGECSCPGDQQLCGTHCTDTHSDLNHCGICGHRCAPGHVCSESVCRLSCQEPLVDCGGSCSNLAVDPAHCGTCNTTCAPEQLCRNGTCSCPDGQQLCGAHCTNVRSDNAHCGECGVSCPSGTVCSSGTCSGAGCGGGNADCAGSCANLQSDAAHCGSCSTRCGPAQICVQGQCRDRCAGATLCNDQCVDTDHDPAHCGGCGNVCSYAHGQGVCVGGSCALGACDTGYADTDGREANGCECTASANPAEICDGVDNDCNGLVDYYLEAGELRSSCFCAPSPIAVQPTPDVFDEPGAQCAGTTTRCVPNPDGSLSFTACHNCGVSRTVWSSCKFAYGQNFNGFDANHGNLGVIEVRFCLEGTFNSEVALWYGRDPLRKRMTLAGAGAAPGCRTVYFRPGAACFPEYVIPGLPSDCLRQCGAASGGCVFDYASADLLLTIAGCSGNTNGTVTLQSVTYLQEGCRCSGPTSCAANDTRTSCQDVGSGLNLCVEGDCPGRGSTCTAIIGSETCLSTVRCLGGEPVCPASGCH